MLDIASGRILMSTNRPLYDFWEMIDDAYNSHQQLPRLTPPKGYYPSSSSIEVIEYGKKVVKGSCLRKLYWQYTGEPPTDVSSVDQNWRAEMGNWVSNMLVEWCKKAGTYVADEVPFVDTKNYLSGRVDLIYQHPVSKEYIGVEIKSIGDYYQRKGTVSGYPLKPKIYHLLQVICYLDFFENHPTFPIKTFEIPYIARCTGERNCFVITRDSSGQVYVDGAPSGITAEMIHSRNRRLTEFIKNKELPDRDFTLQFDMEQLRFMADNNLLTKKQAATVKSGKKIKKGSGPCSWCSYKSKCWS